MSKYRVQTNISEVDTKFDVSRRTISRLIVFSSMIYSSSSIVIRMSNERHSVRARTAKCTWRTIAIRGRSSP